MRRGNSNNLMRVGHIKGTRKNALRVKKFMLTVMAMVLGFIGVVSACVYIYVHNLLGNNVDILKGIKDNTLGTVINLINDYNKNRVTGVIFGVDKQGLRTDVIIVATVDKKNKKFNMISIPRDTRIKISSQNLLDMKKAKKRVPSSGIVKVNAVNAYAPSKNRAEYTVDEIENIIGKEIDYYAKVDVIAFRKIIDAIGGVKFNVPRNMYHNDPLQGLYINLKKGEQVLDGKKAEQLVRYRKGYVNGKLLGYSRGDLDRIEVQQAFMKAAYKQLFDIKNVTKIADIALILHECVDTNFGVANIPEAVDVASKIDMQNLNMTTLPGKPQTINGISYYIYDEEKTKELVDSIWGDEGDKE